MRGPGTSKHCVTNMVADEEAVIAAVITAIFLINKEEKENKEIVYNREIVYKGEETHGSNYGLLWTILFQHIHFLSSKRAFACPEVHLKR